MSDHLHFKDHGNEARIFLGRVWVIALLMLLLVVVLLVQYYKLQVTHHDDYVTQSDRNRIQVQPVPPTRGLIFDRNGALLADNRPSYTLTIVKERVKNLDETIALLGNFIEITASDIEKFQKNLAQRRRPFEAVPLRYQLTEVEIARFAVNEYKFEGVEVEAQLVRHYPHGQLLAHSVGYVGRINDLELAGFTEEEYLRYRGTYSMGKIGLEKQYEDILLGNVGYQNVEINARGRVLKELERKDPSPGQDLHLYLDVEVQRAAVAALGENRGAVVAIDVRTGGVLALVSNPSFDPNLFVTGISVADYAALRESADIPLFDRTLQGQYPPGSTLKPMLGLAGLESGHIDFNSTVRDIGYFRLPGDERRYRDHIAWGHGQAVDLHQAIVESCNTFYYELAHRMGIDTLSDFGYQFGLGQRSGIDLPSERGGIWPSRTWKRSARGEAWYPGDTLNVGVGQGYVLLTPVQSAVLAATLASRGEHRQPRLVQANWQADAATLSVSNQPISNQPVSNQPVSNQPMLNHVVAQTKHWDYVLQAMEDVVHSPKGTARRITKDIGYRMAGKTGTAQVVGMAQDEKYDAEKLEERQRDQALFIGFAPSVNPEIAISVIVENSGHGGEQSAPVARLVLDAYFASEKARLEKQQLTATEGS